METSSESGDAAALYFQLETGIFEAREFYSFLDIDGEEAAIRLKYDIIVQQHHGEIKVETEEGKFTEFVVRLPKNS